VPCSWSVEPCPRSITRTPSCPGSKLRIAESCPRSKRCRKTSELEARLPDFDLEQLDKVVTYARATGHAHVLYMAASSPPGLTTLGEQVAKLREVMCSDAVALAKRGLLDGQRLKELKGPPGYKNMAFDLLTLAAMFREKWSALEGKTPLQAKDLNEAETLADQLISAVGAREHASARTLAASDRRQRAFTLFTSAYDQTRRAISYLRWNQGDLDSFAPSLYAGRGNTKRRSPEETELPVAPPTSTEQPQLPAVKAISAGLPGGSPFTPA
jgi:hypothetical protein